MSGRRVREGRKPLWPTWWQARAWLRRCPECSTRPDQHYDSTGPRWEDDKIAAMLSIGRYGCRRCGHGSIEERDRAVMQGNYTCPTACVEANHPGREHDEWLSAPHTPPSTQPRTPAGSTEEATS